jgi:transposase
LYRRYRGKLDYCMRQDHRGGEKLFVDYGEGLSLIDAQTHEPIKTQLFVAVWGASNYTYTEATLTQQLPDWIGSHVRALEYFGCAPKIVVPDCLKSAVVRACRYEPELNPTYAAMASHYGICILPARPARPRDKAKVENGVLIAKRWILAVLRHRTSTPGRDECRHRQLRALKQPSAALPTILSPTFALRSTNALLLPGFTSTPSGNHTVNIATTSKSTSITTARRFACYAKNSTCA